MSQTLRPELAAEIAAVAESHGCELWHAEFAGGTLRVFLDRPPGGVTLEDCEAVSRELSPLLDLNDFGSGKYFLEVSSPGLDRQLFQARDYERYLGYVVRVTFSAGEPRQKQTIVGRLEEWLGSDGGSARVTHGETGETLDIPLRDIQVARLEITDELLSRQPATAG